MADTKSLSVVDPELECLKLKKQINDNHKLVQKAAGEALERAILTGELLTKWKELLPHGRFESFTETHFDGSLSTARAYMLAVKRLSELSNRQRASVLDQESSIRGLLEATKADSDKGESGGRGSGSVNRAPASSGPTSGEVASSGEDDRTDSPGKKPKETNHRPPRSGKDKPAVDYGKCPNCGGTKWKDDVCAKCKHPHGEPVGDVDEDRIGTQRSKTVKTVEALMRAFDDLNRLLRKPEHGEVISQCKSLLLKARAWK